MIPFTVHLRLHVFSLFILLVNQSFFSQTHTISEPVILVPSAVLPHQIKTLTSNNNLDITQYEGKYYVAFRTAAHHFPNKKAKIYVISSKDLVSWDFEHEIILGCDLREPRFANYNNQLLLYFFEGGKSPVSFQPKHVWVATYLSQGKWENQIIQGLDGYVPWRLKVYDNNLLLSAYWGKDLYGNHQGELRLFKSTDGYHWVAISEKPQVDLTGAEEGEFEFDKEGNLWACVRLEGEGALVCYAEKNALHEWKTFKTKKKYDSSCMFRHKDDIYLIARRNKDGNFAKSPAWLPESLLRGYNLTRYSLTPKTTALYRLNKEQKDFEWIMDIPGCGDNAFPAVTPLGNNKYLILNYSNSFDKPDLSWFSGQLNKTFIYYVELTIHEK